MNTNESYLIQDNQKISGYTVKETTHQEKKHLVVPVTMIVEGVLNGSNGPLLHLASDFGKFPEAWNGIPVIIYHPVKDGVNVSANSPEIIDAEKVGTIYNSKIENNALKAEVWLEAAKLALISPDVFSAIGLKQSIEVSVGVFTEYDATSGTYNGVEYTAIARNHRPDHLALLPGGIGACSIADGCGIRVNQLKKEGGEMMNVNEATQFLESEGFQVIKTPDITEVSKIMDNSEQEKSPKEVELSTNVKNKLIMENEKCTPCVKAKVDALIANVASKFTEEDRLVLETLSENVLDRMIPEAPKEIQVNLSAADQAALDFGRLQLKERRDARIATITANTAEGVWTPEILANMDDDMLERVVKSTKPKDAEVDYSGQAGGKTIQANTGKESPMLPIV